MTYAQPTTATPNLLAGSAAAKRELEQLRKEHESAAYEYALDRENAGKRDALASVQQRIALLEAELRGLDSALVESGKRDRIAAHAESAQELDALRNRSLQASRARLAAAEKVEMAIRALGSALVEEHMASVECWDATLNAARIIQMGSNLPSITDQVRGRAVTPITPALALLEVVLNDVQQAGHPLPPYVVRQGVALPQPTPIESAEADLRTLERVINAWAVPPLEEA